MLTLIFGIRASEPPLGPGELLKTPGLIGLWKVSQEGGEVKIGLKDSVKQYERDRRSKPIP